MFLTFVVPVFAAPLAEPVPPEGSVAEGPVGPPSAEEIARGLAAIEARQAQQEEALGAPDMVAERESSASSFAGVGAQEAAELLRADFGNQLVALNGDPARFLTDATLDEPLGEFGARITSAGGNTELLESSVPVRAEKANGQLKKVDLELDGTGEYFEPKNPLVGLRIGKSAGEGLEIGESSLAVTQVTSHADSAGRAFGNKNRFFPEVATDTDLLVAPTSSGVELFDQLRSAASPETLRFHMGLPIGTELHSDGNGGAQVTKGGSTLAEIPPPSAVDAQGSHVPVSLQVEGNAVLVNVPRQGNQFAYPILVDPQWITDSFGWSSGYNLDALEEWRGIWHWQSNNESNFRHSTYCIYECFGGVQRGLYISTINASYFPEEFGEWWYEAPGQTTYIPSIYPSASATINPFNRANHGCSWEAYRQPHDYDGVWDGSKWDWLETDRAQWYGYDTIYTKGKVLVLGLSSGSGINIPCWRDVRGGGVSVALADPEAPTIYPPTGIPSGWSKGFTIKASASDPGLGVDGIKLSPNGADPPPAVGGCTGLYDDRCPPTREASWGSDNFAEGQREASVSAYDPLGPDNAAHVSSTYSFTTRVDRQKPEVHLEGEFTEALKEADEKNEGEEAPELHLPVYNLKIEATDGNRDGEPKDYRSGVKVIKISLDGKELKTWESPGCSAPPYSCPMEETFPVPLDEVEGGGVHKLEVEVEDWAENKRERVKEFEYFPATGMKEEYVLQHFPLADGEHDADAEEEYGGPELAVNVTNGNLVFHQKDVEVSGSSVDLEVERFYNSQLPDEDNTQWGDGWTLAQTPKLEPEEAKGEAPPAKASMLRTSAAFQSAVGLPTVSGASQFDKKLQAVVTKEPGGGYEVDDQSGETDTTLAFDKSGEVKELRTPGLAKIDYSYEGGDLAEMAVKDPGSTDLSPEEVEALEAEPSQPPTFASVFGSSGFAGGQFSHPADVARSPEGKLWVTDQNHNRLEQFSEAGEYLSKVESAGNAAGQFNLPGDVAIDASGHVWVADTENNRIEQLGPEGQYLSQFGTYGSANGQLRYPTALALDSEGNIWVADAHNNRVEEFNAAGEYLSQFGSYGTAVGELHEPSGIAVDSHDHIWVADTSNDRLQEFKRGGEVLNVLGSSGTGKGQFRTPVGIDVGPGDKVWVADSKNSRVEEFDENGEYLAQFGSAVLAESGFAYPLGIAVGPGGDVWVTDALGGWVDEFSETGEHLTKIGRAGSADGQFSFSAPVAGIAVDSEGHLWVTDPGNDRVQKWNTQGSGYAGAFGSPGGGAGEFNRPRDVAVGPAGNTWVADAENDRIEVFNATNEYILQFGYAGSGNGQLRNPSALALGPEGNVWVADTGNDRIEEFSPSGEYLFQFGSPGSGPGQLHEPLGIAVDSHGDIWVADSGNDRVQEFYKAGFPMRVVGSSGSGNGQFHRPVGIGIGPGNTVWVTDWEGCRVEEFSEVGAYLSQFGSGGSGEGQLANPTGIDVDPSGDVWVFDSMNARVEEFSEAGEYLSQFGTAGSEAGQFGLFSPPAGVATDSEGNIFVTDPGNDRVQEWSTGVPAFLDAFGRYGNANGQFKSPSSVATDAQGHVWVTDTGGNRVQEFSEGGEFIAQFGSQGPGDGQFSSPEGIAIDAGGRIWVSDTGNGRLEEFSGTGEFIKAVGSQGAGEGQIGEGVAIDAGPGGKVWVADMANKRVEEFSEAGEFVRQWQGSGEEEFDPAAIEVDGKGEVWVADLGHNRVEEFTEAGEHVADFGNEGTGSGQFDLAAPMGMASDSSGNMWITDPANNRVQRWTIPNYVPRFDSAFGSSGAGNGQFNGPAGIALDRTGDLWVIDKANDRIQHLNRSGEYLGSSGEAGTGDGQLSAPSALAVDAAGDVWVADTANNRVEQFSEAGEYMSQFGSGVGMAEPRTIAVTPSGNLIVGDGEAGGQRVREFSQSGEALATITSYGSNPGQIGEASGLAVDSDANVWVADGPNHRVEEFSPAGAFLREFGTAGTGDGQFGHPGALTVDSSGNLWAVDEGNGRIEEFGAAGDYITQFGAPGSEQGQFALSEPGGIAADAKGRLWVADPGNERVQRWLTADYKPAEEGVSVQDDPSLEINSSNGLVSSVEGEAAGQTTYSHEGELLTAVQGPESGASYEYYEDESKLLKKVTLPNETWGEVNYDGFGRVEWVKVYDATKENPAAKTTYFHYRNEPRRTTVTPEGAPITVYDIAPDGSVLKWWHKQEPPEIENLSGSLYAEENRETSEPIATGSYELIVQAHSVEGIASIQIIANGNQLVDEKTCDQNYENEVTECEELEDPWVLETGNWPPGILYLEVIVTSSVEATETVPNTESAKFWVNIPYTPPPNPEAEEPPKFDDVLHFREEFGLDLDLNGNETAIDERIFDLIGAWYNPHTPGGEVARATDEKWGVPLSAVDAAELEYREAYIAHDDPIIEQWGTANDPSTYAGYYVDQRAGGLIYVGFTQSQTSELQSLKSELLAPERIRPFPQEPTRSLAKLGSIEAETDQIPQIADEISGLWIDNASNQLVVDTPNPSSVSEVLTPQFGSAVRIQAAPPPPPVPAKFSRRNGTGVMQAGDEIFASGYACTAGFGAWDKLPKKKPNDQAISAAFLLTAGHCFPKFSTVRRGSGAVVGEVRRDNYSENPLPTVPLDAEAIRIPWSRVPRTIYVKPNTEKRVAHYRTPRPGEVVCASGVTTNRVSCGPVLDSPRDMRSTAEDGETIIHTIAIPIGARVSRGDSGAPTWLQGTGEAVGLVTAAASSAYGYSKCTDRNGGSYDPKVDENYICPIIGTTPIQEIIHGSAALYNAKMLSEKGLPEVPALPVEGVTVAK
jgi:sugar lactone lactonase YvrE